MTQFDTHFWPAIDQTLRGAALLERANRRPGLKRVVVIVCVFGFAYGGAMGSYGWVSGRNAFSENSLQILFSAIKVPLLLSATCLISLPSFFVLNTLLGLRQDFFHALKCIVAAQATLSIILASFAPFTLLWYLSASHSRLTYQLAIAFNAFLFGLASVSSQLSLRRMYQPLVQRDRLHRVMLWGWSLVYAFVGIQMGWILRPFVGQPGGEVTFIRSDTWGNAYLKVFGLLRSLIDFG